MNITDKDGKLGLRQETAASYLARDMIKTHLKQFQFAIRSDREAARETVAAYTEGLSGAMSLAIAGDHGSRDEVLLMTIAELRKCLDRDLLHIKQIV
jgi:hypothetical protein